MYGSHPQTLRHFNLQRFKKLNEALKYHHFYRLNANRNLTPAAIIPAFWSNAESMLLVEKFAGTPAS